MAFTATPEYTQTGAYESSASSSRDISLGTFNVGDLIIVCCASQSNPTQTWTHDSATDHFTQLYDTSSGLSASRQVAKYRVMQAGDSATLTIGFSASNKAAWLVIRVRAGQFNAQAPCTGGAVGGGSNSSIDPPNLAPVWGTTDILWLAIASYYSAVTTDSGPGSYSTPAGYGSGTNPHIYSADRALNASSENPGAFTTSSNCYWVGGTIAVNPRHCFPVAADEAGGVNAASTSHVLTLPTFEAGDLIVVHTFCGGSPTVTYTFDGATDKFTQLWQVDTTVSVWRSVCKYRVMQPGDPSTLTVGLSSSYKLAYSIVRVRLWHGTQAPECGAAAVGYGAADPGSVTSSWPAGDNLFLAIAGTDSREITGVPSNYTTFPGHYTDNSHPATRSGWRRMSGTTDDPGQFANSTCRWAANTIVIRGPTPTQKRQRIVT